MEILSKYTNLTVDEMINHPNLLINAFDKDYKILFWNLKCEEYFGICSEKAMGKKLQELLPEVVKDEKMIHLKRAFAGYTLSLFSQKYHRKKGGYKQKLIPIRDAENNVFAVLNIVEDAKS